MQFANSFVRGRHGQATGKDASTISRAHARAKALDDDLESVAGTSLDKGVELDALAKPFKEERCFDPCTGALHRSWQSMHVHVTSRML